VTANAMAKRGGLREPFQMMPQYITLCQYNWPNSQYSHSWLGYYCTSLV